MPPDQEDLNRQLEALERYISDLTEQRRRAKLTAPQPAPESRRPPKRWLLVTGLLVVVALVGGLFVGAVAWSDDRPAAAQTGSVGGPSATPSADSADTAAAVAAPSCKTAVDRANTMLAVAVELQRTLAEYGRVVNDPANDGLSSRELRDKTAPALQTGASASARLDQALADYRQVVDRCKLSTP
jgi:hypothetical protein